MSCWTKHKIVKVLVYILFAIYFINCIIFEFYPTLYPEWFREGVGVFGIFIILFWLIYCIVYLVKERKNKK